MDDSALIDCLERLSPTDFERLLVRYPEAIGYIPEKVSHLERVAALIRYTCTATQGVSYLYTLLVLLTKERLEIRLREELQLLFECTFDLNIDKRHSQLSPLLKDNPLSVYLDVSGSSKEFADRFLGFLLVCELQKQGVLIALLRKFATTLDSAHCRQITGICDDILRPPPPPLCPSTADSTTERPGITVNGTYIGCLNNQGDIHIGRWK